MKRQTKSELLRKSVGNRIRWQLASKSAKGVTYWPSDVVAKDVAYAGKKDKSKKQKGLFLGPRQKKAESYKRLLS
jgi:hypothetical protein